MKALFKSRFPFVELSNEELTKEQIVIKKQYESTYIKKEIKADRLREVRKHDK